MRVVVIGGAGFIGSAVCRSQVAHRGASVLNIDKLTPASSLASLAPIASSPRYAFRQADICDRERIAGLLQAFAPDAIVHTAVERYADDRIGDAAAAVATNFVGTWRLLEAAHAYWSGLPERRRARFRFLSVSSAEATASPTAACRTAADDLVLAWHLSYGLPAMVSKGTDTFGPYQFPDAYVPAAILAAMDGTPEPMCDRVARDWLYLEDHVRALELMLEKGTPGEIYAVGGGGRMTASAMAQRISNLVERHRPCRQVSPPALRGGVRGGGIVFNDLALLHPTPDPSPSRGGETPDTSRLERDTGWRAAETLACGLSKTVRWYLANETWWRPLQAAQSAGDCHGLLKIA